MLTKVHVLFGSVVMRQFPPACFVEQLVTGSKHDGTVMRQCSRYGASPFLLFLDIRSD